MTNYSNPASSLHYQSITSIALAMHYSNNGVIDNALRLRQYVVNCTNNYKTVTATLKDGEQISAPLFQNTPEIRNLIMDYFRYFAVEEIEVLEDEYLEYEEF